MKNGICLLCGFISVRHDFRFKCLCRSANLFGLSRSLIQMMVANKEALARLTQESSIFSLFTTSLNGVSSQEMTSGGVNPGGGANPGGGLTVLKSTKLVTLSFSEEFKYAVAKAARPPELF